MTVDKSAYLSAFYQLLSSTVIGSERGSYALLEKCF